MALDRGLTGCPICDQVVRVDEEHGRRELRCPRCGGTLHARKTASIGLTWALVCTALVFYVPANVLPITRVVSLGMVQEDTILSGVFYFLQTGSWYIALVIFVASIFVPLLKLVLLILLLVSVQRGSRWRPRDRTRLYRITETVGRWSMVDIYVVTILVALVNFGFLANVDAGPAAVFFAAVVIITILAARSFDPRLIWDQVESRQALQGSPGEDADRE